MSYYFPLILFMLMIFTGVVTFVDAVYLRSKRGAREGARVDNAPVWIDYCRSFFMIFLIVFVIRSFLVQPYRVPTGSLEPTVMPGDFILVGQYNYGIKLPIWNKILFQTNQPKRGQIALFDYPVNPRINFVKRVVGVPGDRISYINKVLYINDVEAKQTYLGEAKDIEPGQSSKRVKVYSEDLLGVKHKIQINPNAPVENFYNLIVPEGHYFMMGDNRDNSDDSRYWGFVKAQELIGKPLFVFFSWDASATSLWSKPQWRRIGDSLQQKKKDD